MALEEAQTLPPAPCCGNLFCNARTSSWAFVRAVHLAIALLKLLRTFALSARGNSAFKIAKASSLVLPACASDAARCGYPGSKSMACEGPFGRGRFQRRSMAFEDGHEIYKPATAINTCYVQRAGFYSACFPDFVYMSLKKWLRMQNAIYAITRNGTATRLQQIYLVHGISSLIAQNSLIFVFRPKPPAAGIKGLSQKHEHFQNSILHTYPQEVL